MTEETKAVAAAPVADPAKSEPKPAPSEPTREERVKTLLVGYEHGMNSNSPRTSAELAELKALLAG